LLFAETNLEKRSLTELSRYTILVPVFEQKLHTSYILAQGKIARGKTVNFHSKLKRNLRFHPLEYYPGSTFHFIMTVDMEPRELVEVMFSWNNSHSKELAASS